MERNNHGRQRSRETDRSSHDRAPSETRQLDALRRLTRELLEPSWG